MANLLAEEIKRLLTDARLDTLKIFDLARESELHESPGFGFRPVIWHLAHIGVFEGYWILQKLFNENSMDERYDRIFDPINTPREESRNLPSRREMEAYLTGVRERIFRHLDGFDFNESNPMKRDGFIFRMVLEHEYQHQETLAYLLHMLSPDKKIRPQASIPLNISSSPPRDMVTVPAGPFQMGASDHSFAYDNEQPQHAIDLPAFKIDRLLATNEEYARFVEEGGYERREFWSDEGWQWREKENWTSPLYWRLDEKSWRGRRMFDEGSLDPQHPVTGVSWYEAEAYARFMGKRLPTEEEWEKAASWDEVRKGKRRFAWGDTEPAPALCNFNFHFWGTTPVGIFPAGASATGCLDMTGNVWEWTSTPFAGYAGFRAFPYPEYSGVWFDGDHRVLRGGSWATRAPLLRTTFRNFFRRHFRIAFAGIRCAVDA
ncbi:MAG TPA: ergothioneine biosynthesis protein EgtB [Pyrinomonadaceae bacterium]|nr:ergothioneine biosynthesis protein EgtB [Pyrinomonadaceae bacterium]